MTIANGSQHQMAYIAESTFGTTPSTPTFKILRHNSSTLGLEKGLATSDELRSDRQIVDQRHGQESNPGEIVTDMIYGAHDDFIEAVLGGTWTTEIDSTAITANAADGSFTRTAGDFTSDGFAQYDVVTASGYAAAGNTGRFLVTGVTATVLSVTPLEGQTMSTEAGDGDEQFIVPATVMTGTTRRYFTIEEKFDDVTQYKRHTGANMNTWAFSLEATDDGAIINNSFGIVAKGQTDAQTAISGSTYTAANSNTPFASFDGSIRDNGTLMSVASTVSLNVDNGMNPIYVVGSKTTLLPSIARSNLSGSMTVYYEDQTILDKFINETESALAMEVTDPAGNKYWIYVPRVKYNSGKVTVPGEDPLTAEVGWQGLYDSDFDNNIVVQRVPV